MVSYFQWAILRYVSTKEKGIWIVGKCPHIGLIYGRYLRFRFLKWPWIFTQMWRGRQSPESTYWSGLAWSWPTACGPYIAWDRHGGYGKFTKQKSSKLSCVSTSWGKLPDLASSFFYFQRHPHPILLLLYSVMSDLSYWNPYYWWFVCIKITIRLSENLWKTLRCSWFLIIFPIKKTCFLLFSHNFLIFPTTNTTFVPTNRWFLGNSAEFATRPAWFPPRRRSERHGKRRSQRRRNLGSPNGTVAAGKHGIVTWGRAGDVQIMCHK